MRPLHPTRPTTQLREKHNRLETVSLVILPRSEYIANRIHFSYPFSSLLQRDCQMLGSQGRPIPHYVDLYPHPVPDPNWDNLWITSCVQSKADLNPVSVWQAGPSPHPADARAAAYTCGPIGQLRVLTHAPWFSLRVV